MTEKFTGAFAQPMTTSTGTRQLPGSTALTALSNTYVQMALEALDAQFEERADEVEASKRDNTAMDSLIKSLVTFDPIIPCLDDISEEDRQKLLASIQSKRSRLKTLEPTLDNYKQMLNAASCEALLRMSLGKEKTSAGRASSTQVTYTEEELTVLACDQSEVSRNLRNVQSKKSIMKARADFSPTDERWLSLLTAEEQLKNIRTTAPRGRSKQPTVDQTAVKVAEVLSTDVSKMSKAQLLELISQTKSLVDPTPATTEETEESTQVVDQEETVTA